MLQEEIAKDPSKWEFPDVSFGTDLSTEHERWLSETAFGRATFVLEEKHAPQLHAIKFFTVHHSP